MIHTFKRLLDRLVSRWYISREDYDFLKDAYRVLRNNRDYWMGEYDKESDRNRDLETAYMALSDARAQQSLNTLLGSQMKANNEHLMGCLIDSTGAMWAGAPAPENNSNKQNL